MYLKKITKFLLSTILIVALITPNVIPSANIITDKNSLKETNEISSLDNKLLEINLQESLNNVLSCKYETMKNWNINLPATTAISNNELYSLLVNQNKLECEWYKKVGLKISDYSSTIKINEIKQIDLSKYLVKAQQYVELHLSDKENTVSKALDDFLLEIEYSDNNIIINKLQNLFESSNNNNNVNSNNLSNNSINDNVISDKVFDDYSAVIKKKQELVEEKTKNIDKYAKEFNNLNTIKNIQTKSNSAIALSSYYYNRGNAVSYAHTYALSPNSAWRYYDGEDCTNFVSQCVYYGGIPASSYWYGYTPQWVNVVSFYYYMIQNGYASSDDRFYNVQLGDVVQLYNSSHGEWSHSVILTKYTSSQGWLYCGHSTPRYDYPISAVFPTSTYTDIRAIRYW